MPKLLFKIRGSSEKESEIDSESSHFNSGQANAHRNESGHRREKLSDDIPRNRPSEHKTGECPTCDSAANETRKKKSRTDCSTELCISLPKI